MSTREILPPDQVARWQALLPDYPEAKYTADERGWFVGALRDVDEVLCASTLERLIDQLTSRERVSHPWG